MAFRRFRWLDLLAVVGVALACALILSRNAAGTASARILNVSYDPTRELYQDLDAHFVDSVRKTSGETVAIRESHGGSSRQAQRVVRGELEADVVTLGLPTDIDALVKRGLVAADWQGRLPNRARPYYSTIVFVVRRGNPLGIHDWPDLLQPAVEVITPDPRTSGNGKLTALAAWGAVVTRGGSDADATEYLRSLYRHAPFLVPAAREAGTAFAVEKQGDVQLAWENEALREVADSQGAVEIVYPPVSILAEPSVAAVDANVSRHGTRVIALQFLEYLFSDEAQEIIARDGYRPFNRSVLARHARELPDVKLFPVTAIARDWSDADSRFFGDEGIIDGVYQPKPR